MLLTLQRWLDTDDPPVDVYELLDQPRLCPPGGLMDAVRAANRELIDFQNHSDAAVVKRARRLQMLLGQTEHLLNDDTLLAEFEAEFWQRIRQEFAANADSQEAWQPSAIRQWLRLVHNLSPGRLDEGVNQILRDAPARPAGTTAGRSINQPRVGQFDLFETTPREALPAAVAPLETQPAFESPAEVRRTELPPETAVLAAASVRSAARKPPVLRRETPVNSQQLDMSSKSLPWVWIAVGVCLAGMFFLAMIAAVVFFFILKGR